MKKTLFAAAMALIFAGTATTAEAHDKGKHKKKYKKEYRHRSYDDGYTYRNGSYYDRNGAYIGTNRPVQQRNGVLGGIFGQTRPVYEDRRDYPAYPDRRVYNGGRKAHPVHGPGWVPPGQRKKMQRQYDSRW